MTTATPTEAAHHPAIAHVLKRQAARGWSDTQVSRLLGLHQSAWWHLRTGQHRLTKDYLRRIRARFPDCPSPEAS